MIEQITQLDGKYTGAMSGIFDLKKPAKQILEINDAGSVFIYLFRRFGYPRFGWDDQKTLVKYYLSTSMDGVILVVEPDVTGAGTFGYMLREDLDRKCIDEENAPFEEWHARFEEWALQKHGIEIIKIFEQDDDKLTRVWKKWGTDKKDEDFVDEKDAHQQFFKEQENIRVKYSSMYKEINPFPKRILYQELNNNSIIKQCYSALCDAIEDLKKPVFVRDVLINISGEIKKHSDDDVIEYSNMAGIGVGDKLDRDA